MHCRVREREGEKGVYRERRREKEPLQFFFPILSGSGGVREERGKKRKGSSSRVGAGGKRSFVPLFGFLSSHQSDIYIRYLIRGGGGETVFPDLRRCAS